MRIFPSRRFEWWSGGESDQTLPFIHFRHIDIGGVLCERTGPETVVVRWDSDGGVVSSDTRRNTPGGRHAGCPKHEMRADL